MGRAIGKPRGGAVAEVEEDSANYEQRREERIVANRAKLTRMGISSQKTLLHQWTDAKQVKSAGAARVRKLQQQIALAPTGSGSGRKRKAEARPNTRQKSREIRTSPRLRGSTPQYVGIKDDEYVETQTDGRIILDDDVVDNNKKKNAEAMKRLLEQRCNSKGRGSIYDNKAGITCHFCRQKKLCGEPNCPRCSTRSVTKECIGKSECQRCGSHNGRFCRACLLIRYGLVLEDVREQMAQGKWLCPHCYEEDHPEEGWICNSSICMTRRGLAPTGIAIYEAQERGFLSVAHFVQAKIAKHKKKRAS